MYPITDTQNRYLFTVCFAPGVCVCVCVSTAPGVCVCPLLQVCVSTAPGMCVSTTSGVCVCVCVHCSRCVCAWMGQIQRKNIVFFFYNTDIGKNIGKLIHPSISIYEELFSKTL